MTDIERIDEIIREIDVLIDKRVTRFDSEFKQWHNKAKRFLYNKFGADSIEYKEFEKIKFTFSVYTGDTTRHEFAERCHKDLMTAKGIFTDYLNELRENESAATIFSCADDANNLERIFTRFRKVVVQLSRRHDGRETLKVQDEYDVQDLLYALLSLYYDDIRPEEWTPSYAGSSVRMDFLISEIESVIEVKKTRNSMTDKTLSEELIIDIEKYQKHPSCSKIYCFVYDPDMVLRNPAAIKNDLEQQHLGLVKVYIES